MANRAVLSQYILVYEMGSFNEYYHLLCKIVVPLNKRFVVSLLSTKSDR